MMFVSNFSSVRISKSEWMKVYNSKARNSRKEIDVVLVGDARMRSICEKYYKKPNATVLTFKYDNRHGEIILNVSAARKEAKKLKISTEKILTFWFKHGLSRFV